MYMILNWNANAVILTKFSLSSLVAPKFFLVQQVKKILSKQKFCQNNIINVSICKLSYELIKH